MGYSATRPKFRGGAKPADLPLPDMFSGMEHLPPARWPAERFKKAAWNPRSIDQESYAAMRLGLERFGLAGTLNAREEDGLLIGGHQRFTAVLELIEKHRENPAMLKHMNLEGGTIPVAPVKGLNDAAAAALNILLNNAEAQGRWNTPALTEILSELDARGFDVTATGFSEERVRELLHQDDERKRPRDDDDEVGEIPETADSKPGRLYQLGRHRLLCGDARIPGNWLALLEGKHADLVVTDPPYNVDYEEKTGRGIQNDKMDAGAFRAFLQLTLGHAYAHSRAGANWYVCAPGGRPFLDFAVALSAIDVSLWRQTIIWVKDRFVLSRQDYHWRSEAIFSGEVPELAVLEHRERTLEEDLNAQVHGDATGEEQWEPLTIAESVIVGWRNGRGRIRLEDRTQDNVWEIPRPARNPDHPTMKPMALVKKAIINGSKPRARVLDCFAGSGQTMLAADALGRTAFCMELDPRFCDVIRRRYSERTSQPQYAPDNALEATIT